MSGNLHRKRRARFWAKADEVCRRDGMAPAVVLMGKVTSEAGGLEIGVFVDDQVLPNEDVLEYWLSAAAWRIREALKGRGKCWVINEDGWSLADPPGPAKCKPRDGFRNSKRPGVAWSVRQLEGEGYCYHLIGCPRCEQPCLLALESPSATEPPGPEAQIWAICEGCKWASPLFREPPAPPDGTLLALPYVEDGEGI